VGFRTIHVGRINRGKGGNTNLGGEFGGKTTYGPQGVSKEYGEAWGNLGGGYSEPATLRKFRRGK